MRMAARAIARRDERRLFGVWFVRTRQKADWDCLLGPYAKPEGDFKCKQIFGAAWRRNRKRYTRRVGIVKNTFHIIRHRNRDLVPMNLRKKQKISTIILVEGFFNIALLCPLHATLNILFFTIIPSGTYIISYMYSLRQLHCANWKCI